MRNFRNLGTAFLMLFLALALATPSTFAQTGPTPAPTAVAPTANPTATAVPLGNTVIQPDVYNVVDQLVNLPTYTDEFMLAVTQIVSPTAGITMTLRVQTGKVLVTTKTGLKKIDSSSDFVYIWSTAGKNINATQPDAVSIDANGADFTLEMFNAEAPKGSYTLAIQRTTNDQAVQLSASSSSAAALPTPQVSKPPTAGAPDADPLAVIQMPKKIAESDNSIWGWLGFLAVATIVLLGLSRRRA